MTNNENPLTFYGLGISPNLLDTIEKLSFKNATPIQHKTIPLALDGKDVIGIAQTGTGKTMAFAIPMVQRLVQTQGIGLVIVPTRELALQVLESFTKVGPVMKLKAAAVIGGEPIKRQLDILSRNPRIIIATPGRLIDLMNRNRVRMKEVSILVLDEADQMFDMGFQPQIEEILKQVPATRQTMIFSATMPPAIMKIVSKHMQVPVSVEVAPAGTAAEKVTHELFIIHNEMKHELLNKILRRFSGSALVFCRTKMKVARLAQKIRKTGHSAVEIHSDRSLSQRKQALQGFKMGRYRILVATDIAARGIDVKGVEVVINFDLPETAESYVHRIGRTGRAGCQGHAISIATPDQKNDVTSIENLLKIALPRSTDPDVPNVEFNKPMVVASYSRFRSRSRGRRR